MGDSRELEQRRQLAQVLKVANISVGQLWLRYFGSGGTVGDYDVDAYIQGLISLPALQRDILALSANELVDELPPLPRAPLSEDIEVRRSAANGTGAGRGARRGGGDSPRNGDRDGRGSRGEDRRRDYSGGGTESDGNDDGRRDEE